jgi:hypothetical protein
MATRQSGLNHLDMICFRVSSVPSLGDLFTTQDGREYQLISTPKDAGMQGGLLAANARYTYAGVCIEKVFYFEVGA